MRFRILGPLEAWQDGHQLELGAGRQRALLALLLLHPNEIVSADRLIDELWGEHVPPSAPKVVQGYVSQLRRVLPPETIVTHGSGYLLQVTDTDAVEFERLLAEARLQEPQAAAQTLRAALALWRGRPFADVAYEPWAQTEMARLEELRLVALEERIESELQLGDMATRLVPELEALVAEHRLRERLPAQLMLALYRSGRQAEALDAYAAARKRLVEELGIEPGPELQELQHRILAHDPKLGATRQPRPLAAVARRAPWLMAAGAVVLAGAGTAAGLLLTAGRLSSLTVIPNSVGVIDPSSNRVVRQIAVGDTPTSVALGEGAVWVLNSNEETISRIDPTQMTVVKSIGSGPGPIDLAAGAGAVWAAEASHTLVRVEPDTSVASTSHIPGVPSNASLLATPVLPSWVASDGAAVWVTNDATVSRVAPAPQLSIAATSFGCCGAVAIGAGSIWVTDAAGLLRLDAHTGARQAHIDLPFAAAAIAVGAGSVWAADQEQSAIWRIDPRNNTFAGTIAVGNNPAGVAVGAGSVWVASGDGTVSRINPATNLVVRTIHVGGTPNGVAVGAGKVWVTVD